MNMEISTIFLYRFFAGETTSGTFLTIALTDGLSDSRPSFNINIPSFSAALPTFMIEPAMFFSRACFLTIKRTISLSAIFEYFKRVSTAKTSFNLKVRIIFFRLAQGFADFLVFFYIGRMTIITNKFMETFTATKMVIMPFQKLRTYAKTLFAIRATNYYSFNNYFAFIISRHLPSNKVRPAWQPELLFRQFNPIGAHIKQKSGFLNCLNNWIIP